MDSLKSNRRSFRRAYGIYNVQKQTFDIDFSNFGLRADIMMRCKKGQQSFDCEYIIRKLLLGLLNGPGYVEKEWKRVSVPMLNA
ncbi:hypothetical protein CW304_10710 [Bacillus sp. UFRGS-B20]|nr:hypothetical protein CW304_10710 [Bacillus sp. UFRGS-B20]